MAAPTPATAPWQLPATALRLVDGDTQVFRVGVRASLPEEVVILERDFVVRLLEVDTPERDEAGWAEATAFAREFLFDGGDLSLPRSAMLHLTGRKDPWGRWLGWCLVDGVNLSSALCDAGLGEYSPLSAHLAALEAT